MGVALKSIKLGLLAANRSFFSAELAAKMRAQAVEAMRSLGIEVVVPDERQTKLGCVENLAEAELCAELFRAAGVDGIVVIAANFGDEQAAAWTVRQTGSDVPVLLFGCQEEGVLTRETARRDAFCGLLSIGEALRQMGVRYSVASRPIGFPADQAFRRDLDWFVRVCRVVNGVRHARYGQVGTRPEAFWTCRFDERQLQRLGPTTVVLDLPELVAGVERIRGDDPDVRRIVQQIREYADTSAVSSGCVVKAAKLELFLDRWREEHRLDALAVQCWTSMQRMLGLCPCLTMSRLGEAGLPCACEADVLGALSMHACMLASGSPAALADWNNLHNEDDELVNIWHCGVFPKSFAGSEPKVGINDVLVSSGAVPRDSGEGTVQFLVRPSSVTLARVTQGAEGSWKAVVVEGQIEDNAAETFGGYGWCRICDLDRLYRDVLLRHFPHHVAVTQGRVGAVLWEAFGNYLGFEVYHPAQAVPGAYSPASPFWE